MTSEKALKDLKELRELWELNCWSNDGIHWELVDKVIEDLEALEIIRKRQIDVQDIIDTADDYDLYVAYCKGKGYADEYICNEKEFKSLREVLVDEN